MICFVSTSAAYGVFCFAPLYHTSPVPQPTTLSPFSFVSVRIVLFSEVITCNIPVLILMSFFLALAIIVTTIQINYFFKTGLTLDLPSNFLAVLAFFLVTCPLTGSQRLCLIPL